MKALTLTQPYATLIAIGAKRIETRSWATSYRGPLAIHAGKGLGPVGGWSGLYKLTKTQPFKLALEAGAAKGLVPEYDEQLPFGAVIAVCDLIDCRSTSGASTEHGPGPKYADWVHELSEQERAFGDYTLGRYGWLLANVRVLPEPIPAKGALSLWEWQPPEGIEL